MDRKGGGRVAKATFGFWRIVEDIALVQMTGRLKTAGTVRMKGVCKGIGGTMI